MAKYGLTPDSKVIWVSPNKWDANRYNLPAEMTGDGSFKDVTEDELDVVAIDPQSGTVIFESNDGDNGYLFAYNKVEANEQIDYDDAKNALRDVTTDKSKIQMLSKRISLLRDQNKTEDEVWTDSLVIEIMSGKPRKNHE